MNINQYFSLLGNKKQTIAFIMVIFLSIAILVSAFQPFNYGSSLKLLTINTFKETDPYTASKSNEYLSNLLSQIVSTNSFFEKVKNSSSNIDKSHFGGDQRKQMKKWNKTVKAKGLGDTGMIAVDVYHTDPAQAAEIARSVAYVLQTEHANYHGFGQSIQIKMIDEPITSSFPVKPNIILNLSLALIFGILFSLAYVYLFPEERYDLKVFNSRRQPVKMVYRSAAAQEAKEDVAMAESLYPEVAVPSNYNYDLTDVPEIVAEVENNFEEQGDMSNILKR
jgi:capsular polysaccharide biosynthesis protein